MVAPETFGEKLKRLRAESGLSQAATAEKIGISLRFYQSLEMDEGEPGFSTIEGILRAYGFPQLLTRAPGPTEAEKLIELARLFANANPVAVEHALRILREVGKPQDKELYQKARKSSS